MGHVPGTWKYAGTPILHDARGRRVNYRDRSKLVQKASNLLDHPQGEAVLTQVKEQTGGIILAYFYFPATHRVAMEAITLAGLFEIETLPRPTTAEDWAMAHKLYEEWVDPDLYEDVSDVLQFGREG